MMAAAILKTDIDAFVKASKRLLHNHQQARIIAALALEGDQFNEEIIDVIAALCNYRVRQAFLNEARSKKRKGSKDDTRH
jgi:hypothetical protein